jgi:cytosine/adenosine deaminase-related metal-dependent hydrolase
MGHGVKDVLAAFAAIERARAFGEARRLAEHRLCCGHCQRLSDAQARGWEAFFRAGALVVYCPHCGPLKRVEQEWRELTAAESL